MLSPAADSAMTRTVTNYGVAVAAHIDVRTTKDASIDILDDKRALRGNDTLVTATVTLYDEEAIETRFSVNNLTDCPEAENSGPALRPGFGYTSWPRTESASLLAVTSFAWYMALKLH